MIGDLFGSQVLRKAQRAKAITQTLSHVGAYAAGAAWGKVSIKDRNERLRFFTQNVSKWTSRTLPLMNFEVSVIGYDAKMMAERNFLLVGNHMSYLDIFVLSSVQPCVFVTSVDMGQTPFLGQMAEMGGSLFIERRHRGQIEKDIGAMAEVLKSGHHVVIYPEGTSGDGQQLLPFKKGLLTSAVVAGRDLLPICLKYTEIDGEPFGRHNADKVCWYGDMTFAPHFLQLFERKSIKAELHFLDPIKVTPESTRYELAEKSFNAINFVYSGEMVLGTQEPGASFAGEGVRSGSVN